MQQIMSRNKSLGFKHFMFGIFLMILPSTQVFADSPKVYTGFFSDSAVSGYDTVAYFTEGKPVKGQKQFKFDYMDAEWFFKNKENLELFKANPEKYAPQYGGYCAWSVSQGNHASADPEQWTIVDGKLYLNYDQEIQDRWLKKKESFIQQADSKWPDVLK